MLLPQRHSHTRPRRLPHSQPSPTHQPDSWQTLGTRGLASSFGHLAAAGRFLATLHASPTCRPVGGWLGCQFSRVLQTPHITRTLIKLAGEYGKGGTRVIAAAIRKGMTRTPHATLSPCTHLLFTWPIIQVRLRTLTSAGRHRIKYRLGSAFLRRTGAASGGLLSCATVRSRRVSFRAHSKSGPKALCSFEPQSAVQPQSSHSTLRGDTDTYRCAVGIIRRTFRDMCRRRHMILRFRYEDVDLKIEVQMCGAT